MVLALSFHEFNGLFDLSTYPNLKRWYCDLKNELSYWDEVHGAGIKAAEELKWPAMEKFTGVKAKALNVTFN